MYLSRQYLNNKANIKTILLYYSNENLMRITAENNDNYNK